ncbi:MAG: hydrogenase formation protein HypD [Candidatus Acidiferrum sp.]
MKYLDEYRDAKIAHGIAAEIRRRSTRPWVLMEICGGQTHTLMRYGIDELLGDSLQLVHGPGCPVCVTPIETIDRAIALARIPDVTLVSYGDMLRVPGSDTDLFHVKAEGGDVRVVYSPTDAVQLARSRPDRKVVFFAIGFETTAPAHAMAVSQAERLGLRNFSLLVSHVLVPPAIRTLLSSPKNRVQGFIAPGHVCAVVGCKDYEQLVNEFRVPIVVGGFEPLDLLEAIRMLVAQLEEGRIELENQYSRSVQYEGNKPAQEAVARVFEITNRKWRGIGPIPASGLCLKDSYALFDAEKQFDLEMIRAEEPSECISAEVLLGLKKPTECPAFGTRCTQERPLGAPMVSSEGACAAYYQYRRHLVTL